MARKKGRNDWFGALWGDAVYHLWLAIGAGQYSWELSDSISGEIRRFGTNAAMGVACYDLLLIPLLIIALG